MTPDSSTSITAREAAARDAQQAAMARPVKIIRPDGREIATTAGEAMARVYGPAADLRGARIVNVEPGAVTMTGAGGTVSTLAALA